MNEWRRSLAKGRIDREGVRARLTSIMGVAIAREIDDLGDRLNVLATIVVTIAACALILSGWLTRRR